jgi:hypothetical protein
MKANLLKKITLNALITMNIDEKRNLGLKSSVGGVEIEPFKYYLLHLKGYTEYPLKIQFGVVKHFQ